jgi:prolyl-tRNA synthetase
MSIKGITVKKSKNFSEWFTQVVKKAELADIRYGVAGFIVHLPNGYRLTRTIYEYLEKEFELDDHEPMLFPIVTLEENLKKEEEHAGFTPEVYWITEAGSEKLERRLALRPTGETQIYPMYSLWVRSYNDLPLKRYQSRITVYRNEMNTRPFLRGREFMFMESHDVFVDHKGAMDQIYKDMEIMDKAIWEKLFIPFIFFRRPQWDKFKGADDTYASDTLNPDGRRNQISSTHDLGTNFAKAFDVKFIDESGENQYAHQTCFGPGIWRITAALIAIHGDNNGLILPFDIAPTQVVVVPITFSNKEEQNEKLRKAGETLTQNLKKLGFRVQIDTRDLTPGEKFNIWELKGVPLRIELGPKELETKTATIVYRTDRMKHKIDLSDPDLANTILSHAEAVDEKIKSNAEAYFKGNTKTANSLEEVKDLIKNHRGFVKAPFCSIDWDGEECSKLLKDETGAYVCGVPLKQKKIKSNKNCIICEKSAKQMVYIALSI